MSTLLKEPKSAGSAAPLRGCGVPFLFLSLALSCLVPLSAEGTEASPAPGSTRAAAPDSGLSIESLMGFKDADPSASALDWKADSGGPDLTFEAHSSTALHLGGQGWLSTGPAVKATGDFGLASSTDAEGLAILLCDSFDLKGLAGWGATASLAPASSRIELSLDALVGLEVLDLTDQDPDYLPAGADPEDFWFRVLPCLGFDASASWKAGALSAVAQNRYLATWDSGSAYGSSWAAGFEERLKATLGWKLADAKGFGAEAKALGSFSLDSGLIEPRLKLSCALRADLDWKKAGSLKLSPLEWSVKEYLPGLSLSGATEVQRQLSASISWEAAGKADWSLALSLPWWADEDGASCPGTWAISFAWKVGD